MEEWMDVVGYEGYYMVSNFGRVKSLDRYITRIDGTVRHVNGRIMTPKVNQDGYLSVTLNKNGNGKSIGIHRLVASHFLEKEEGCTEVNHIDFNRKNNRVENLEWCTHKSNIDHSSRNGRYKERNFNGEFNPNYGSTTLRDKYRRGEIDSKILSRPGSQNGRSVEINMLDNDRNLICSFDWIGGCAEYMIERGYTKTKSVDDIRNRIRLSIKNDRPYYGFYFEKQ